MNKMSKIKKCNFFLIFLTMLFALFINPQIKCAVQTEVQKMINDASNPQSNKESDGGIIEEKTDPLGITVAGKGSSVSAVPRGYKAHDIKLKYIKVIKGGEKPLMIGVNSTGQAVIFHGEKWDAIGNKSDFTSCEMGGDGALWAIDAKSDVWCYRDNAWINATGVKARSIAVGTKDEVYIVTPDNRALRRIDAGDPIEKDANTEKNRWRELSKTSNIIAVGGDGTLWMLNSQDLTIYSINRETKKWMPVVKPAQFGMGNPKFISIIDKFNIIFVDYQGQIFRKIPGASGAKFEDWEKLSDFRTAQASIGHDGTIVSVDEQGAILERIPLTKEQDRLEKTRGLKILSNQITQITSSWGGHKLWTHAHSQRDPNGTNPIPNNPCELRVGTYDSTKDPRSETASFFMFTKTENQSDISEIEFGSTVEIWSLYAAAGHKNKAGGLGKSWKWWIPENHINGGIKDFVDIVISIIGDPNTKSGAQVFKLVSPYGLTGPIRSNDVVEIVSMAPGSKEKKIALRSDGGQPQPYRVKKRGWVTPNGIEVFILKDKFIDAEGQKKLLFGSRDRGGTQFFSIRAVKDETDIPEVARDSYRSISGIAPSKTNVGTKKTETLVNAGLGILDEVVNKSPYPVETSVGQISGSDARQQLKYKLSNSFAVAGFAREREIAEFDAGKMLTLQPMWNQGIAWIAESLKTPGSTTVMFMARAGDDGNIQVVFGNKVDMSSMFRVIIGAEENSKSIIKMGEKILAVAQGKANLLAKAQPGRFIPYWVSLSNNFVLVGVGAPGENVFLSGYVPLEEQPNRVGFSSNLERIEYTEIQFANPLVSQPDYMKYNVKQQSITLSGQQGAVVMSDYVLRVPNEGAISFSCQAKHSITTILQNAKGDAYRIIIGGANNTQARIYKNSELALAIDTSKMPIGKIDSKKENNFWISLDGGLMLIGEGGYGENIFLAWQDNEPLVNISKIGWVTADHSQTISKVAISSSVTLGAEKEKFSYKKPIPKFNYKGSVFVIKQYTYEIYQNGPAVTLTVFKDRNKSVGTPYPVAKTPQKDAQYPLRMEIQETGIPLVYQSAFPTESPAKIQLEEAAEVSKAISDASFQAAQSISGGQDNLTPMIAMGLKMPFIGAGVGMAAKAAKQQSQLRTRYRDHDSYVYTEGINIAAGGEGSVPPEAERNAELISMDLIKMRKLNATYPPQFEELVNSYEEILRRINHPYTVADTAIKYSIFDGFNRLCQVYKTHQDFRLHDLLFNLLTKAISNTYLINPEDKTDSSNRNNWYGTMLKISNDIFKYAQQSQVDPETGAKKDGSPVEIQPLFGEYLWLPNSFPFNDTGLIVFEAKALNDVFVGFAQEPSRVRNTDNQVYEVVLGGWENTRHVLRIKSLGKSAKTLTKEDNREAMLKQNNFEKYWIFMNNGLIKIGKGEPGKNVLIEWQDPFPWTGIKYVGFSCWDVPITLKNIQIFGSKGPGTQKPSTSPAPAPTPTNKPVVAKEESVKNEPEIKESASPVTQNSPSKSTQSESQSTPNTQQTKTPEQEPAKKNLVGIK